MKRCAMLFLAHVVGLFAAPAFSADYTTQLNELRKTNSAARAAGILDATNPLISSVLVTDSTHPQSNTTLAAVPALGVTLRAGKTYLIRAVLFTTANVAHGNKVDLGGGTATVTAFRGIGQIYGAAAPANTRLTAITTSIGANADNLMIVLEARIVVNAAGTLVVQHAQNTSGATNSTIQAGSYITAQEV
jgi:hypothetical protein